MRSKVEESKKYETIVFVCNSETDGFREGDGDLMDKLVINLNAEGMKAVRIVMYKQDVPSDKRCQIEDGSLICLSEKREKDPRNYNVQNFQDSLEKTVLSKKYAEKEKVLYIGSRLDWGEKIVDGTKRFVLKQSGCLFDASLIKRLKEQDVKIVICCLEYKFFMRSVSSLRSAFEMMKQQLFLADAIHFLTKKDHEYFKYTLNKLETSNGVLKTMDASICDNIRMAEEGKEIEYKEFSKENQHIKSFEESVYDFSDTDFEKLLTQKGWADTISRKTIYSRGIYTVNPILKETAKSDEGFIKELSEREKNIVQFGMIRSEKGIDEALELSQRLVKAGFGKLYIVGKVREMPILRYLIMQCFSCTETKETEVTPQFRANIEILYLSEGQDLKEKIEELNHKNNMGNYFYFMCSNNKEWYVNGHCNSERIDCTLDLFCQKDGRFNGIKELLNNQGNLSALKTKLFNTIKSVYNKRIKKLITIDHFTDVVISSYNKISKVAVEEGLEPLPEIEKKGDFKELGNIAWRILENYGMDMFNKFASYMLDACKELNLKKLLENVEIRFNADENELKDICMDCRYAIKIDHKGMAENASSIVSCLGFYLPVFTMRGYLTSEEFCENGKYSQAIICPKEEYCFYINEKQGIFEIRPKEYELKQVFNDLINETDEKYLERIKCLYTLYKDNFFTSSRLVKDMKSLFIEITKPEVENYQTFSP